MLAWHIGQSQHEEPQPHFSWLERGGPPARAPKESRSGTLFTLSLRNPQISFEDEGFERIASAAGGSRARARGAMTNGPNSRGTFNF
jgi:hypothetical protein